MHFMAISNDTDLSTPTPGETASGDTTLVDATPSDVPDEECM